MWWIACSGSKKKEKKLWYGNAMGVKSRKWACVFGEPVSRVWDGGVRFFRHYVSGLGVNTWTVEFKNTCKTTSTFTLNAQHGISVARGLSIKTTETTEVVWWRCGGAWHHRICLYHCYRAIIAAKSSQPKFPSWKLQLERPLKSDFWLGNTLEPHEPKLHNPTWLLCSSAELRAVVIYCLSAVLSYLCLIKSVKSPVFPISLSSCHSLIKQKRKRKLSLMIKGITLLLKKET